MENKRSLILHWAECGAIPLDKVNAALKMCEVLPTALSWRKFIDHLLLFTGVLALASAVIFFFAYNWDALGRFAKFALVEALIVASLVGYWWLGSEQILGKAVLLLASILIGALLALFGQTYQTGADPWQLFATWALLILPWVLVGRFAALWLLWIVLINLSMFLYFSVFSGILGFLFSLESQLLMAFAFNTIALAFWEFAAHRYTWLAQRWAVRLLAIAGGFTITMLMVRVIIDAGDPSGWIVMVYLSWVTAMYFVYRLRIQDLFMLAGGSLSIIVVVTAFLARTLLDYAGAGGFLFIAIAVIAMSAAAAIWLKRLYVEQMS